MEENALAINKKAVTYIEHIKTLLPIKTANEYLFVGQLWKDGKALLKEIDEGYDDLIKAAHNLHKDAIVKKAKYYTPTEAGVKVAKRLMSDYDAAQEAIRQSEERRLREIARKAEEERILQEAIEAVANGYEGEAEIILQEELFIPPIIMPKTTPKINGGPVFRTIWKFKIIDVSKIPDQYKIVDEVKVGQVVRALKKQTNIPGIMVYEERC